MYVTNLRELHFRKVEPRKEPRFYVFEETSPLRLVKMSKVDVDTSHSGKAAYMKIAKPNKSIPK